MRLARVVDELRNVWEEYLDHRGEIRKVPPADLVSFSKKLVAENPMEAPLRDCKARHSLSQIWKSLKVDVSADTLDEQVAIISGQKCSETEYAELSRAVLEKWQPHWRKPPTKAQFLELIAGSIPSVLVKRDLTKISCALKSLQNSQNRLPTARGLS